MSDLIRLLSVSTGLTEGDLHRIIRTAPRRYKVFEIAKRSGGTREIAQPAREVKFLQRVLVQNVLSDLPVHAAARAYRKGVSILGNAATHAGATPILKMDFKNFFPSIRSTDWETYCREKGLLAGDDIDKSSHLLFRRVKGERLLRLSIGAPSSPILSNVLMFNFDEAIDAEAKVRNISYTRYADDLTFSGQRAGMLKDMIKIVVATLSKMHHPRLSLNADKTTFITTSRRRTVTGVVLANDGSVGLGRDRKRLLSAQLHHASLGRLSRSELAALCGQLAFANVVEPAFLDRMRLKYGDAVVQSVQRSIFIER